MLVCQQENLVFQGEYFFSSSFKSLSFVLLLVVSPQGAHTTRRPAKVAAWAVAHDNHCCINFFYLWKTNLAQEQENSTQGTLWFSQALAPRLPVCEKKKSDGDATKSKRSKVKRSFGASIMPTVIAHDSSR